MDDHQWPESIIACVFHDNCPSKIFHFFPGSPAGPGTEVTEGFLQLPDMDSSKCKGCATLWYLVRIFLISLDKSMFAPEWGICKRIDHG
jgi:hypothetical protein